MIGDRLYEVRRYGQSGRCSPFIGITASRYGRAEHEAVPFEAAVATSRGLGTYSCRELNGAYKEVVSCAY
jgi:hypothetical protein